jgi:hypothetical protein
MTIVERSSGALEYKGNGYVTFNESPALGELSKAKIESIVQKITGEEYSLMTVNNCTDNRKYIPDQRVYTLLLTSVYNKQNARRIQKAKAL